MTPILETALAWKPKVKDRPRWANGRMYTPKATQDAEKAIADQWRELELPTFDDLLAVEFDFTNENIFVRLFEAADYENRKLRGDVDNYLKLAGDALNGVAYVDDRQIVRLTGAKL
jgi:Holliday junction resolvase RusA-like endonuclease